MGDPGLHSKFVEMQQQDFNTAREAVEVENARLTSLKLSRSRILGQLEKATNPNYRAMLTKALSEIEAEVRQYTK